MMTMASSLPTPSSSPESRGGTLPTTSSSSSIIKSSIVENDSCALTYYYQGTGPLLLFIPGARGSARAFFPLLSVLASRGYTAASYDRRQMSSSHLIPPPPPPSSLCTSPSSPPHSKRSRSKPRKIKPRRMNPPEQARDVAAVATALGFPTVTAVFGTGIGGTLALQFALDFPGRAAHVVAHEAPTPALLPDASALLEWVLFLSEVAVQEGWRAAEAEYRAEFATDDDDDDDDTGDGEATARAAVSREERDANCRNFWENEFDMMMSYVPDLVRLRESGCSVGVLAGERSGETFCARAACRQAEILGCLKGDAPGQHHGFKAQPERFAVAMLQMLESLEKQKKTAEMGRLPSPL